MKRVQKFLLRGLGAALAALILVALVCLDGVDYRPYFRQPYYTNSVAGLRALAATNALQTGMIEAGFGRAKLTPAINSPTNDPARGSFTVMPLAGYGDRQGRPAEGAHDDLFVKAVAIRVGPRTGIFFGADALIVPREVADAAAQRIEKELGLAREQLYFSATHTHCSLGGWGEGFVGEAFAGKFDPGARLWFAECLASAARTALADLKPASFGHGRFAAAQYVRNRLVGEVGSVDPDFNFAVVQQTNGATAILGSFSAHATVLSGKVMEFSGDYPGYWQRAIEEKAAMAVFLAGCVGSHGPVPGDKGFAGAEKMGAALAQLTLEHLPGTALTNRAAFGIAGLAFDLPNYNVRLTSHIRLRPWISARLLNTKRDSYVQAFRLGQSLWISTPCDFSGELGADIKNSFAQIGYQTIITSFNGDYIGYVIPPRYYHLGGYEPQLMSFYGPCVPDYLSELMRRLASTISESNSR